ncbi:MAG: N-acetylglucosamine kinase [Chitinophagaceae bacterium]
MAILLADSGATKCEWCLVDKNKRKKTIFTQGISPYFLTTQQIEDLLKAELLPRMGKAVVDAVYYYGTGCTTDENALIVKKAIVRVFPRVPVQVKDDVLGAARALCGDSKGLACILGTGSSVCFYNGKKIVTSTPGLGYVLGDEGSGAYLGKKVLQYFLYKTFDEELYYRFEDKYKTSRAEILENIYKRPLPNRYLASFAIFLAENRGHYMVENIIEDGLNDFFFTHLCKYTESWKMPIHFVGGVSYAFKDVIKDLCHSYEFEMGKILKNPMEGLVKYHVR